jgi:hypothetical protein
MRIYNNIVYDNGGGIQGPTSATDVDNILKNNLVYKNAVQFDLASPSNSTRSGEVMADPQFVNYIRTGGGDYHLKSTSPAINRGLSALSLSTAPSTDLDGNFRNDGAIDIGAYEYGSAAIPIPAPAPAPAPTPAPVGVPDISFSPSSVTFVNQVVGTVSTVTFITLKNTGNADLDLSKAWSISGDFAFANQGTCSASLAPGATCTVSFRFSPTAIGVRSGKFTMSDNTAAGSHSVALSGTGTALAQPVLSLSTSSLTFAAQKVGTRSSAQTVILKNTGNAVLIFPAGFIMNGNFAFGGTGTCKVNVAYSPGSSCTATVVFTPKAIGIRNGSLSIQSNASSTPSIVNLSGTGY